jgi:mannosyltransferase
VPRRPDRPELIALGLITLVAIGLRVYHLGFHSLNGGDEPFSIALAQRPFFDMLNLFGFEANGTLYSIVLWPLARIGDSEELIRSPALVAGVLAVPATWWAGRELASVRVGLVAALLIAVNPMAQYASQLARPFAFVMLFGALSFALLAVALRDRRRRWWIGYIVAMAGAAYSNSLTPALLLLPQLMLVWPRGREAVRDWFRALVGLLIVCLPLAFALIVERGRRDPLYWLERAHLSDLKFATLQYSTGLSEKHLPWKLTGLIVLVLAVWVAVRGVLAWRRGERFLPFSWVLLAWAVLPVLGLFIFSQVSPAFRPIYAIACLPGIMLVVAAAALQLPRIAAAAAVLALVAIGVTTSIDQARTQVDENWRAAMAWIDQQQRPGDRYLVDIPAIFTAYGYYDHRFRASDGELQVIEWKDHKIPANVIWRDDPGGYTGIPGPPSRQLIAQNASGGHALFVTLSEYVVRLQGDVPNSPGIRWARQNCQVVDHPVEDITLLKISGCPTA